MGRDPTRRAQYPEQTIAAAVQPMNESGPHNQCFGYFDFNFIN